MKIRNKRTGEIKEVSEEELSNYINVGQPNINLNLPQKHRNEMNPIGYHAFLANDRNANMFIGGANARYQNEDFSVGPYAMGVGNKQFQKFPADYGVSGTYHVNDNFDINMNVGKNSKGVGIRYKFKNGGGDDEFQIPWTQKPSYYKPGTFNKSTTPQIKSDNTRTNLNNSNKLLQTKNAHLNIPSITKNEIWVNNLKENPIQTNDISHGASNQSNLDFYNKWINSGMANSMMMSIPTTAKNKLKDLATLTNPAFETNDPRIASNGVVGLSLTDLHSHDLHTPKGAYVKEDYDSTKKAYILYHELSHQFDDNGKAIPNYFNKLIHNSYNNKPANSRLNYIGTPTETRARLNEIRKFSYDNNLFDVLNQPVKKEDAIKFKNQRAYKDLKERYNEDDILFLLNNVAKNQTNPIIPIALNGLDNEQAYFRSPFQPKSESAFPLGMMNTNVQGSTVMPNLFGNQSGFDIMKQDYNNVQSSNKPKLNIFENFGLREFNGIIDGVTAMANSHTDYQNRRDEMAKLAEFYQQPSNPNFDRDGRSSMPMYFKNGGGNYVVKKGDNLTKISKATGVDIKTIMANNKISKPNYIKTGQKLILSNNDILSKFIPDAKSIPNTSKAPKVSKSISVLDQLHDLSNGNPVVMHYAKEMLDNGNRLLLTDKGSKTTYYVNKNNKVVPITVGTGGNDNPKQMTRTLKLEDQFAAKKKGDLKAYEHSKITPVGRSAVKYHDDVYGSSGLITTNPTFQKAGTLHQIYPGDYANRMRKMNTPSPKDNNFSYGCTNCIKSDLDPITALYGRGNADSIYTIDSRVPISENQKGFDANAYPKPKGVVENLKSFFNFRNGGGGGTEIQGLPFKSPLANAVVETREAVQFGNGDINVVASEGPYVQDHGDSHDGTYLPDVKRVLEATSTKLGRNHKSDKLLAMSPDDVEQATGYRPKSKKSHAQAYDEALKFYQDEQNKINAKKEKVMKQRNLSDAQINALRLNDMFGSMAPTSESLFESLFGHQEEVKAQHGISNEEPLKFKKGGVTQSEIIAAQSKASDIKKQLSWTTDPAKRKILEAEYNKAITHYNSLSSTGNSGYQDWLKSKLANAPIAQPTQNGKKPIVFKQSAKSSNAPINSNKFQAIQTAPINIAGIGAGDNPQYSSEFGSFVPPYTNSDKPNWYDQPEDVWNQDLYPYTQQYMGMPDFNNLSPQSQHSQYQNFISQQYGPLVLDAYRNGIMPLNNSHMQLAASLGKQPKDLTDEEILKGYQDDKQNVRGILTQRITDPQGRDEIKRNFRPVNFNGKTMYVEQNPEGNMPITYYDLGDELTTLGIPPYQVGQSPINPTTGEVSNPNIQSNKTPNQNVQYSNGQSQNTQSNLSNGKKEFGKNRVPLEWYDMLSPISALVNASGRYPEMPFRADINQLNYNLLDPQSQLNEITAQTRPVLKDASNDSVGQAMKAQLLSNASKTKADVIGNMMNANSQILNHQTDYNTTAKDKQSVMDATAAQDFHNRVLQSKSKQDEAILSSIDSFGKLISKNKQFNNILGMLDTNNFGYDPETKGIAFNNAMTYLTGNGSNVSPYENPMGNTKTKSAKTLTANEIQKLTKMQTEDPNLFAQYVVKLRAQGYEL